MNLSSTSHVLTHPVNLSRALSPQSWPFALEWLPETAYLVGGSVRDGLLQRVSSHLDLDFVLPAQAIETARAIARHYRAGFVVLDQEHQIARVVFDDVTVDFAQQVGDSLKTDLYRRDFTINAIAYHPHTHTVVDPLDGQEDLRQNLIRMISPENLEEDPLRLLRAYRQAAQLNFYLDPETDHTIQSLARLLQHVAPERIYNELSYLLSHASGTQQLFRIFENQLLCIWLPHASVASIQRVQAIDHAVDQLVAIWPELKQVLHQWPRDQHHAAGGGRSWLKVAKLACLVDNEKQGAEAELRQLKCSRLEIQSVLLVLHHLPLVQSQAIAHLSRREQFFLFKELGDLFPSIAALAIAHGLSVDGVSSLITKYLTPDDPVAHPQPLITGRELMAHLKLSPGPKVGSLLSHIEGAQAEGSIHTAQEAIAFAEHLIHQEGGSEFSDF
ncbi:MAG: CCA tRNA nucleotidyltransferase [Leptolyngbyaceae bacterium]|nr:CCA tRNA nucleotidyltransferase [Leptolyngbyaceae bacterium]